MIKIDCVYEKQDYLFISIHEKNKKICLSVQSEQGNTGVILGLEEIKELISKLEQTINDLY